MSGPEKTLPPVVAAATGWALEKKALDPVLLDVRGLCAYADFLLVLGGRSTRQVKAVAESISRGMRQDGHRSLGQEGANEGRWVLLDYGEVVVHIFLEELREFYDLESLWVEAPRVPLAKAADAVG
ncbi:MAG: ribosome silencing factor [bacterium]